MRHSTPALNDSPPAPSHSTPVPSGSTPVPSGSTPVPSDSTPAPSGSTPAPGYSQESPGAGGEQGCGSWGKSVAGAGAFIGSASPVPIRQGPEEELAKIKDQPTNNLDVPTVDAKNEMPIGKRRN